MGSEARALACTPVPVDEVEWILVIRPGGLGDAALTFPMLTALHEFYHRANIDVLTAGRNADVYRINQLIGEIYRYDQRPLATLRQLRRIRYDIVIDTEQFHHLSSVIGNALRPRYLCGFDTLSRGRFQTHPVTYGEPTYEVISFLKLAESLMGRPVLFDPNEPFIDVSSEAQDWAGKMLESVGDRALATIMPTATAVHRFWPAERYAQVVRWLVDHGFYVVIVGDTDALPASSIIAKDFDYKDVLNLAGRTTLPQTAALLQRARIYVSADTGVLHLAYGVGTSTVSLFGSGNHKKWVPPGRQHVMIRKALPCSPCTRFGHTPHCPHGVTCMDAISIDDVTSSIEEALRR